MPTRDLAIIIIRSLGFQPEENLRTGELVELAVSLSRQMRALAEAGVRHRPPTPPIVGRPYLRALEGTEAPSLEQGEYDEAGLTTEARRMLEGRK